MIEVEFIPVGEKTDTGDAILVHFTEPEIATERVVLIDGGFTETAEKIVDHIQTYYGTSRIDLMICTHPDDDHINGLFGVLEQARVDQLLIHRPRNYGYNSDEVKASKVDDLIALAQAEGTVVVTDAYAGHEFFHGALRIAGPTVDYYVSLLNSQVASASLTAKATSMFHAAVQTVRNALTPRGTDPGEGELVDHGGTSARNNTSIIVDVQVDGYRALFTGDAGAPALERAADYLEVSGRSAGGVPDFFDVPHHGSRHNLTSSVMNRLAGPVVGDTGQRSAFVSVGAEATEHPRSEVANAFKRRGYTVSPTHGQTIRWHRGAASRTNWVPLTPLPWLEPDN
ncbi:ComEC/Rec2 family competence protein [Microbacterium arborescens]|uniref:ComEC/Rec2 family competence protein n=1 Tax=Microbacterium arborescens TaxID=33883 RepID=UPI0013B3662A|nr:MBL fold metallo-hydrolase [Microbacterium arborescens]